MFYYASKIAWFFATPSNLLPALVVLGLLLMLTRLRRTGWALAFFGGLGLFAGGLRSRTGLSSRSRSVFRPSATTAGRSPA
jgi:hypothetical protein